MVASQLEWSIISQLPRIDRNEELTILLGAGASVPSGLPSWKDLIGNMLRQQGMTVSANMASLLCDAGDLLFLAEAVKQHCGNENEWKRCILAALYPEGASYNPYPPSYFHQQTARLAFQHQESVHLATLNFDLLLEYAIARIAVDSGKQTFPPVEHLHGKVFPASDGSSATVEDVVLTYDDYNKAMRDSKNHAKHYLEQTVTEGQHLLIAGTSFSDPDMRFWLSDVLQNSGNSRATVLIARESMPDVTLNQFMGMKKVLAAQWESIGFHPIFVNDYTDAATLINEIGYIGNSNYCPPATRTKRLWKKLTGTEFRSYQERFAEKLHEQASQCEALIGHCRINVTLWIAHGSQLTRYATHDRIYLYKEQLRNETVGFDSPYIAGRVLGTNQSSSQSFENGIWKQVMAFPIQVQESKRFSILPMAVLSIGIGKKINSFDNKNLAKKMQGMVNEWSSELRKAL